MKNPEGPVRLKPGATRLRVIHFTTEPRRTPVYFVQAISAIYKDGINCFQPESPVLAESDKWTVSCAKEVDVFVKDIDQWKVSLFRSRMLTGAESFRYVHVFAG